MPKLSEYVEMAATEYLQDTGKVELDAVWIAEFFESCGIRDDYPRHDLVAFHALVQKALAKKSERADREARREIQKVIQFVKDRRRS